MHQPGKEFLEEKTGRVSSLERERVTGVELGIEYWGPGPLGDDKEPSFMASATVRTLAYFR